jgi:hypothetical protein
MQSSMSSYLSLLTLRTDVAFLSVVLYLIPKTVTYLSTDFSHEARTDGIYRV